MASKLQGILGYFVFPLEPKLLQFVQYDVSFNMPPRSCEGKPRLSPAGCSHAGLLISSMGFVWLFPRLGFVPSIAIYHIAIIRVDVKVELESKQRLALEIIIIIK